MLEGVDTCIVYYSPHRILLRTWYPASGGPLGDPPLPCLDPGNGSSEKDALVSGKPQHHDQPVQCAITHRANTLRTAECPAALGTSPRMEKTPLLSRREAAAEVGRGLLLHNPWDVSPGRSTVTAFSINL